jgi:Clostridial hydrophobic W
MNVAKDGQTIGTTGRNLAMNGICIAIKDKSTGKDSQCYDVHYRVTLEILGGKLGLKMDI